MFDIAPVRKVVGKAVRVRPNLEESRGQRMVQFRLRLHLRDQNCFVLLREPSDDARIRGGRMLADLNPGKARPKRGETPDRGVAALVVPAKNYVGTTV